jgi:hypothetical protein
MLVKEIVAIFVRTVQNTSTFCVGKMQSSACQICHYACWPVDLEDSKLRMNASEDE